MATPAHPTSGTGGKGTRRNNRLVPSVPPSTAGAGAGAGTGVGPSSSFSLALAGLLASELQITQACSQLGKPPTPAFRGGISAQAGPPLATSAAAGHEQLQRDVLLIQSKLNALERAVSELRAQTSDEPEINGEEQAQKMNTIEKHAAIGKDLRSTLRTSILRAGASIERAAAAARLELVGSSDEAQVRRQRQYAEQTAADKNATFTRSLQRTRSLLNDEIARSTSALSTLTSSTRVLGDTSGEYDSYGKTVKIGSKIITKQLQRERTDKLLILVGLCFFTLVVCYILNRRLSPFLLWWTTFFVAKAPTATQPTNHHQLHQHQPAVTSSTSTTGGHPTGGLTNVVYHAPMSVPTPAGTGEVAYTPIAPVAAPHSPHTGAVETSYPMYAPPRLTTPEHDVTGHHHHPHQQQQQPEATLAYADRQRIFLQQQEAERQRQLQYVAHTQVPHNQLNTPQPGASVHLHSPAYQRQQDQAAELARHHGIESNQPHAPQTHQPAGSPAGHTPSAPPPPHPGAGDASHAHAPPSRTQPPDMQGIHAFDEPPHQHEHGHGHGHAHAHDEL